MGLFLERKDSTERSGHKQVPVWFMRQAGRYHGHYQKIRREHTFMEMCKRPELAAAITMGPVEEFNFDAAILFSDLLFPLEQLGLGLSYDKGPPQLSRHLLRPEDLKALKVTEPSSSFYAFQREASYLLRHKLLPQHVTLLGFVGGPFTLYTYAVEGAHAGNLVQSKLGLVDGRFRGFMEMLFPVLLEEMLMQAEGGADAVCIFDTAAGELSLADYRTHAIPHLRSLAAEFKKIHPGKKVIYYSKNTHLHHLRALECPHIDVLGVDWRVDLKEALATFGKDYYIQGNMDPAWLHLPWSVLEKNMRSFFEDLEGPSNLPLHKWIFGLGHGVLIETPEENVKKAVAYVHRHFSHSAAPLL